MIYQISPAPGNHWTLVRWRTAGGSESGTAYVEYVPALRLWMYDDYHDDGAFYRDFSSGPDAHGVWRWYDAPDQRHIDRNDGPESWSRSGAVLRQRYQGVKNGKLVTYGSAVCAQ